MNYEQYREVALRTIKPHKYPELGVCDWMMGIMGEVSEVHEVLFKGVQYAEDKMELAKECSDVIWYATALIHELELEVDFEPFQVCARMKMPYTDAIYFLHLYAGQLCEMMKHKLMHNEDIDMSKVNRQIAKIFAAIDNILWLHGIDIEDAAALNAAKLSHRYGGGKYHEAASANRRAREGAFKDTEEYKALHLAITGEEA